MEGEIANTNLIRVRYEEIWDVWDYARFLLFMVFIDIIYFPTLHCIEILCVALYDFIFCLSLFFYVVAK